ncbi:hypothetical protein STSP2_00449 [Anaerohalosphaera lusitana]|uniref:Uncharacterized protein n=1 Tax=Anaerohalosphaera lusitana TaxID=1936003 RepID=A0A1U9NIH2_9BACT|nr:hypothetical protein [Anaerohalosphaera lusitana]AQT67306.1 hypothetical protein STSP2_00449 [Anaerohalosphaera lusitana]
MNKIQVTSQLKKLLLVIFLTVLIWAWAYNALEDTTTQPATLSIYQSPDSALLVEFVDRESPIDFEITVKGPASGISELERKVLTGEEKLDFVFNAKTERKDSPGRYVLDVLQFVKNSAKIEVLGLTVESVSIDTVEVEVEQLVQKQLTVQVLDENGLPLEHEDIKPSFVETYVRPQSTTDSLKARVTLTPDQIEKARKGYITAQPIVEISPNEFRQAAAVQIKLPPTADTLENKLLPYLRVGFLMGDQMEGRYEVELINANEVVSTTRFQATDEAWAVYENMPYQIVIPVYENDAEQEKVTREVIYNFPHEFLEKGEIKLTGSPRTAEFRLLPVGEQNQQQ